MIQSVIFDLDGLLIDSEIVSYRIYRDMLQKYGHDFTVEYYAQNLSGKTSFHNMNVIVQYFHLPITVEEGLAFSDIMEENYIQKGIDLKKGAKELLEYLRTENYKISLASSSTHERALAILR